MNAYEELISHKFEVIENEPTFVIGKIALFFLGFNFSIYVEHPFCKLTNFQNLCQEYGYDTLNYKAFACMPDGELLNCSI